MNVFLFSLLYLIVFLVDDHFEWIHCCSIVERDFDFALHYLYSHLVDSCFEMDLLDYYPLRMVHYFVHLILDLNLGLNLHLYLSDVDLDDLDYSDRFL